MIFTVNAAIGCENQIVKYVAPWCVCSTNSTLPEFVSYTCQIYARVPSA